MLMLVFVFLALSLSPAYTYWVWTPKTGKFINPKTLPKSTPKEQFDYSKAFMDKKDYKSAKREFLKLLKNYPKSFEASEAQYYLGVIEEDEERLYEAYKAYQKVIDKYPFSERIAEVNSREYNIAEAFVSGVERKAMGITLPVENPAIEILNKVIENSSYGPLASKAQYKLGLVLKGLLNYYEAEEAFNKVVTNYPDSEWAAPAKFQLADCRAALSRGPDYDQGATREAKDKFESFVQEHPDAVLSTEAKKNINRLREQEAEGNYNAARFYEKQKAFQSAEIYYNEVMNNYSDSPWAAKAFERLRIMENRK
ncbi:MAG: outer membrane protein assembly factor BamD [Candidatus Omnitrophota bacterium]|nr:outer membrane protein assembly factor BamD [Candidatus Omnitrophota bacterium]